MKKFFYGDMGPAPDAKSCAVAWLGRVEYMEALKIQKGLAAARSAGRAPDVLMLLEHPPTYTMGRRAKEEHLLVPRETLEKEGFAVYRTDRGGDVTYHGPGQLVGYPVISLTDRTGGPSRYLRKLEEVILTALRGLGVAGECCPGYTGVWVGSSKIAAIGVKIDVNRVTQHGFALNVTTDLHSFRRIVPCGIKERGVTNLECILGRPLPLPEMVPRIAASFSHVFGFKMVKTDWEELHDWLSLGNCGENRHGTSAL